jgi:small subunit ribosomal protein S2e
LVFNSSLVNLVCLIELLVDHSLPLQATFECLMLSYGFLTPEFWRETRFTKSPFQEHTDLLAKPVGKLFVEEPERLEA